MEGQGCSALKLPCHISRDRYSLAEATPGRPHCTTPGAAPWPGPAEKARLQERAAVLREWIKPKSRKLLST